MAKKIAIEPAIKIKQFASLDEIKRSAGKLQRRISDVKSLKEKQVRYDDQDVDNVVTRIRSTICEIYGENSPEFRQNGHHCIWRGGYNLGDSNDTRQGKFEEGIPQTIKMLEGLIEHLEEKKIDLTPAQSASRSADIRSNEISNISSRETEIFIVHGHDHAAANEMEILLQRHGLKGIVLHRQPDQGRTLIEKIENYAANVSYVIVILTPDDTVIGSGPSVNKIPQEEGRARQNVIFEWGYFVGKFGREHVCCVYKEGTVLPSDVSGVVYKPFRQSIDEVKYDLLEELKASGLKVS